MKHRNRVEENCYVEAKSIKPKNWKDPKQNKFRQGDAATFFFETVKDSAMFASSGESRGRAKMADGLPGTTRLQEISGQTEQSWA